MKTIGIIGGTSWESTKEYYRIINEAVRDRVGKLHSAKLILHSLDMQEVIDLQNTKGWGAWTDQVVDIAKKMEMAGADFFIMCTNTAHKIADDVQARSPIPLLHIGDSTAQEIKRRGLSKVGLLGTGITMREDFYTERLKKKHGIEVIVPDEEGIKAVDDIIFKEICLGKLLDSSREKVLAVIDDLVERGAQGIILGCTEIPLLVRQEDMEVPIFDTLKIHAMAAINLALE